MPLLRQSQDWHPDGLPMRWMSVEGGGARVARMHPARKVPELSTTALRPAP